MRTVVLLCFHLAAALAQQHGQPSHHPDGSIMCLSDQDCSCIESFYSVYCIANRCECIPELGKRQATAVHSVECEKDKICTCSDGSTGHCSHEGNCHCPAALAQQHGQPSHHPDGSIMCLSDQDCSCIESYDSVYCISNRCECIPELGKRQATAVHSVECEKDKICTCSDGSTGHCSHEGNCHCLTLAEQHGQQPGHHPDGSITCLSDQDCSCIESYDIANCISNRCECISVLGKRQATSAHAKACDQVNICTCSDGSTGHCSQEGNCHCHHR